MLANSMPISSNRVIHDALAYAYDHLEEIDGHLVADDELVVKVKLSKGERS